MITLQQRREYNRYLKSEAWRRMRAAVLYRDANRCRVCGARGKGLEAHHLNYERFLNEKRTDLITLCANCHAAAHKKLINLPRELTSG